MFGVDTDQEYTDTDTPEVDDDTANDVTPTEAEACLSDDDAVRPVIDPQMKAQIFEGVVAVFNRALPDFLARSVDPKAEERLLAESLDKSIDRYLDTLVSQAEEYVQARLKTAIDTSKREADRLRGEVQQIEQQRTSLREQQLSADRRRRALADRVTDLEQQLAGAEAEREQLQLENKSMLNKLKVADIQPGVVDELTKEIERLKAELAACAANAGSAPSAEQSQDESLKAELDKVSAELETARAKTDSLREENATLQSAIENLKEQAGMGQIMYNDMQEKYATEREKRRTCEEELAEAKRLIDQVAVLQEQFARVETLIQKRDERIEKLKASNKRLKEELASAKQSLESFGEPNLFACEPVVNETVAETPVDDDFECPEWFVSEPDAAHGPLRAPDDGSFGYTEPPKKPKAPESDAQLSLF